jgi:hypothetical protein
LIKYQGPVFSRRHQGRSPLGSALTRVQIRELAGRGDGSKPARASVTEALDGANRYAILYRVQTAAKPETRVERIARFVAMCARGETIYPPRRRKR